MRNDPAVNVPQLKRQSELQPDLLRRAAACLAELSEKAGGSRSEPAMALSMLGCSLSEALEAEAEKAADEITPLWLSEKPPKRPLGRGVTGSRTRARTASTDTSGAETVASEGDTPVERPKRLCPAGLHSWSGKNVIRLDDGGRECARCRKARVIEANGGIEMCRNNLHPVTDENSVFASDGYRRCRPCRQAAQVRQEEAKKVREKKARGDDPDGPMLCQNRLHEMVPGNVRLLPSGGKRCIACQKAANDRANAKFRGRAA